MVENIKKEYKIIDFIIFTPKKMHYQSYKNGPGEETSFLSQSQVHTICIIDEICIVFFVAFLQGISHLLSRAVQRIYILAVTHCLQKRVKWLQEGMCLQNIQQSDLITINRTWSRLNMSYINDLISKHTFQCQNVFSSPSS